MLTPVRPASPRGLAVLRRLAIGWFAAVGAIALAQSWWWPHPTASSIAHSASGVAMLSSALVLVLNGRASRSTIQTLAVVSLGLVTALVWLSDPLGVEPWLVLGPVVLLAALATGPALATGLVAVVMALGLGVVLRDPGMPRLDVLLAPAGVAAALAVVVHRSVRRAERDGPGATPSALLDHVGLRTGLDALVEQAVTHGEPLAVAVVAAVGEPDADRVAAMGRALVHRSRADDLVAVLPDGVAVALPGAAPADAVVFAARAAVLVAGLPEVPGAVAGVATVLDAADTTDVLLRRARRALRSACDAGDGHIAVDGPSEPAVHVAEEILAVPGAGGRQR